jgi:hypothetical protein
VPSTAPAAPATASRTLRADPQTPSLVPPPEPAPTRAGGARTDAAALERTAAPPPADRPLTAGKLAAAGGAPTAFVTAVGIAAALAFLLAGGTSPVLRRVSLATGRSPAGARARTAVAAGTLGLAVLAAAAVAFALSLVVTLLL